MKKFLETSPTSRDVATVQELQIMVAFLSFARTEKMCGIITQLAPLSGSRPWCYRFVRSPHR